jgi:F0F1-type ATP synthase membrane subunit b/b'
MVETENAKSRFIHDNFDTILESSKTNPEMAVLLHHELEQELQNIQQEYDQLGEKINERIERVKQIQIQSQIRHP